MSNINAELLYPCTFQGCAKEFNNKYNLRRHIRSCHLKIKEFGCEICGMKLASKQTQQEHLFTHTGEKPFKCDLPYCTKQYRQSSQLSIHRRKHLQKLEEFHKYLPCIAKSRVKKQKNITLPLAIQLRNLLN